MTIWNDKCEVLVHAFDSVSNEMIKYGMPLLLEPLTKLFNLIFMKGTFPKAWNESFITLIHIKGNIARNHGWFCSWIFINQIASCMTSANKRWTIFGRRWWKLVIYFFYLIIFHHSFDHINNFIIICDRIKINCHHMFIRNPMMCVKDRKHI
jgi:hypothetical protein